MSVHVISWVLRESEATLGDRLVLLVLADKAEEDGGNAWPSVATIAREARLTERQVQRCLRSLEASGAIVKEGRHRKKGQNYGTHVYSVVMTKGDNLSPLNGSKGDIYDLTGGSRVSQMSPDPSLELQPSKDLIAAAPQNGHSEPSKPRPPNPVWDALSEMFGEPSTRPAQKERGQVCRDLTEAGATADEIFARAKRWALHFDHATLTDHALVKHWHTLPLQPRRIPR